MKITFPHMGYLGLSLKMLLRDLEHEPILPPQPSKRTLDLGVKHSPEFACIPFKFLMGTYLETIEMGAEMAITYGGVGPCRAGYYGILHQQILDDLGYDLKILVFEPPLSNILDFFRKTKRVKPRHMSWRVFWGVAKKAWNKLRATDDLERLVHEIRPYEILKGDSSKAFKQALALLDQADNLVAIEEARKDGLKIIEEVVQDRSRNPLRIGIIGEIYVVLEPAANYDIQITLGEMGVYTHRSIWLTDWTRDNTLSGGEKDVQKAASPYLNELIGGHGINSVGETVLYARHGYDGVIQLAPFSCIPEIVAKGILPRVSRDLGIPVLTIFIDEQTGKAGIQTRLEAFVDLLMEKKHQKSLKVNLA
jgi:predicted nucleotide-binding protein (sugar kinase/HSP70/actin superfamily)